MTTKHRAVFSYHALAYHQRPNTSTAPRFLLFHAPAGEIIQWADVDRIKVDNPKGAQRPIRKLKINKIARFLDAGKLNTIPTAIIVALDEGAISIEGRNSFRNGNCTTISIKVRNDSKPGLIIDGQHRAYGVAKHSEATHLNVVAFLGGDEAERAFQFVVINNTATRISKDHIKALNLNYNPRRLNQRLLASSGIGLGLDDTTYDDLLVIDTSEPFRRLIAWPRNAEGFIPPNAVESALAEVRDRAGRLAIEGFERDIFLSMWATIKRIRAAEWNSESNLLLKVSIYCVTVFILENLITIQTITDPPIDLTDEDQMNSAVDKIVSKIPAAFWTAHWTATELDTRAGRSILLGALQQITSNVSHVRPWHENVELIEPTSLLDDEDVAQQPTRRRRARKK
jgi:hypothetical protein